MTVDERIAAIAMNLELLGHHVEDGRRDHKEWLRQTEEWLRQTEERLRHTEDWLGQTEERLRHTEDWRAESRSTQRVAAAEMADLRENIASLAKSTDQLLKVVEIHDKRLGRLEHPIAS